MIRMRGGRVLEAQPESIVGHRNIPPGQDGVSWPYA